MFTTRSSPTERSAASSPARPVRRAAAALWLAALPGCAGTTDLVGIEIGGDNACLVDVDGQRFSLPADGARLAARLRRAAGRAEGALLSPRSPVTRPGCWDSVMALTQAAGFARVGYFSESPAEGPVG